MKYYEYDGKLRAYANRVMLLFGITGLYALASSGLALYLFLQPPVVVRVDKDGVASVVGNDRFHTIVHAAGSSDSATALGSVAPSELEGRARVREFLERYQNYKPESAKQSFDDALKLMTPNLKERAQSRLDTEDTIGKIASEHVISELEIRSIEHIKSTAWTYVCVGVKKVSHVKADNSQATDRMVVRYNIGLVETARTETNPSGLLVAEYGEQQLDGQRKE